jgi:mono/diheme cytochrome c family protein
MTRTRTSRLTAVLFAAVSILVVSGLSAEEKQSAQEKESTQQKEAAPEKESAQEKAPDKGGTVKTNPLYKVVDGFKVGWRTMNGFRAWRAGACDRCHGASQQGLVGPSLIESLKTLSKEEFVQTVIEGRLDKGMPSFKTSKTVMDNIDNLYAYLKGRSNGDITQAHVQELKEE